MLLAGSLLARGYAALGLEDPASLPAKDSSQDSIAPNSFTSRSSHESSPVSAPLLLFSSQPPRAADRGDPRGGSGDPLLGDGAARGMTDDPASHGDEGSAMDPVLVCMRGLSASALNGGSATALVTSSSAASLLSTELPPRDALSSSDESEPFSDDDESASLSSSGESTTLTLAGLKSHPSDAVSLTDLARRVKLASLAAARRPLAVVPGLASSLGSAFWSCLFYSAVSTSMIIVNKLILTTFMFEFPMVLLFHQSLMTILSLFFAKQMGIAHYDEVDRAKVIKWLPIDVLFVGMLLTSFYSVKLMSVPMVTIFKNTNNIFIAAGDALCFGNVPSRGVMAALLLMLAAAVMAGLNDLEYTAEGYGWTGLNCLVSTTFLLYLKATISTVKLTTFGQVFYNNLLALPLVLLADCLVFGDFQRLLAADRELLASFLTPSFQFFWLLSGVLGFLQSLSSLLAQKLTSPTTYSMVGSLNKIPLTLLGVVVFSTVVSPKGALYVGISILAGMLYSWTKTKEEIASRLARQQQAERFGADDGKPETQPVSRFASSLLKLDDEPSKSVSVESVLAALSRAAHFRSSAANRRTSA